MRLLRNIMFISIISFQTGFGQGFYANNRNQIIPKSILTISNSSSFQKKQANTLPIIKASGDQIYCPQTSLTIVTDFTITDPVDTETEAIYIQISIGYNALQDILTLTGTHPNLTSSWDSNLGKLKIAAPINGVLIPYTELIAAVKDVVYTNISTKPTGNRGFSISIEKTSYFPLNQHFYEFISAPGISWGDARIAVDAKTFNGVKGYLATILSAEEQQLVGEQLTGTGWIGGSDYQLEGEWRWITGPEAGTLFWSNLEVGPDGSKHPNIFGQGYTPNFAFWNRKNGTNNEPNNGSGFENYAHIIDKDSTLGIKGSWTDLAYNGTTSGPMKSRGYIVEYGGTIGDPVLQIASSSKITIPQITETKPSSRCDKGEVELEATTNIGNVYWYENEIGGSPMAIGNKFKTPILLQNKTYYVETNYNGCSINPERTPINATIYNLPIIKTSQTTFSVCGPGEATLKVETSEGETYWYEDATSNSLVGIGTSFTRNFSKNRTYYVEAVNNGCSNGSRVPINIVVYDLPEIKNEEIVLCKTSKTILDATLTGISYLWSTGENTKTIEIQKENIYTVDIKLPAPKSCTIRKTITVTNHPIPQIKNIVVDDEATVTIQLSNPKPYYEFSINGINYQESPIFTKVNSGIQTAYIREKNSCDLPIAQEFIVIGYPKYFTPNGDGFNDILKIDGIENYPDAEMVIFDRYGKLIIKLDYNNTSWDGTYNNELLPASDYWYVLKLDKTSAEKRGHFSLMR